MRPSRVPVKLDAETYAAVRNYAQTFGLTLTKTLTDIVDDWLATVGAARLERLEEIGSNSAQA